MWTKHLACGLALIAGAIGAAEAQDAKTAYSAMAPLTEYLVPNETEEIALARSAAPPSVSAGADVLTLTSHGYKTSIKGTNGFVCLVERSWAAAFADAEFWNPNLRAPICHNRAAVRSVLAGYILRTGWVLAGISTSEMISRTQAALAANEFVLPEAGAISYMMSKQGHLHDADGHWHPHVMLYVVNTDAASWGANLDGSPVFADGSPIFSQKGRPEPATTFFITVTRWSDGTPDT